MKAQLFVRPGILVVAIILPVAAFTQQRQTSCDTTRDHALYSWKAAVLTDTLESPDAKKVLAMKRLPPADDDEGSIRYTVAVGGRQFSAQLPGFNAEISWSPDSSAFAVTETEGGGGIGYGAYIFRIGEGDLQKTDLSPLVAKAFGSPAKCEVPVPPNVGFIGWLDCRHVLVAAEVVPVSICQCMGMFAAYEISLPELRIVRKYSQLEAKKKFWGLLGCELRDADDGCAGALHWPDQLR